MIEIWKELEDFKGYEISSLGRLRSYLNNQKGRVLKMADAKNGYKHTILRKNNSNHHRYIHRLVAETFIPNPYNFTDVNHINSNKKDNRMSNLEWCTRSHNVLHCFNSGIQKRGPDRSDSKLTADQVFEIRNSSLSQRELGEMYGLCQSSINQVIHKRTYFNI